MSTMMQAYPSKTFVDDEMKPLVSGRLTVYVHDSNVKADVFTLEGANYVHCDNPMRLDEAGRLAASIFTELGVYDVKLEKYNGDGTFEDFDNYEIGIDAKLDQIGRDSVDTIEDLMDLDPSLCSDVVTVMSYPVRNYIWDPEANDSPDGGVVVDSDVSPTGRWLLLWDCPYLPSSVYGVCNGDTTNANALFDYPAIIGSMNIHTPPAIRLEAAYYDFGGYNVCTKHLALEPGVRFDGTIGLYDDLELLGRGVPLEGIGDFQFLAKGLSAHSNWFRDVTRFWQCGADYLYVDNQNYFDTGHDKLLSSVDLAGKSVFGSSPKVATYMNNSYFKLALDSTVPKNFFSPNTDFVRISGTGFGDEVFSSWGTWDPGLINDGHHVQFDVVPDLDLFSNTNRWVATMMERRGRISSSLWSQYTLDLQGRTADGISLDATSFTTIKNATFTDVVYMSGLSTVFENVKANLSIDCSRPGGLGITANNSSLSINRYHTGWTWLQSTDSDIAVYGIEGIDPCYTTVDMTGGSFSGMIQMLTDDRNAYTPNKSMRFTNVRINGNHHWYLNNIYMVGCSSSTKIDLYPEAVSGGGFRYNCLLENNHFVGAFRLLITYYWDASHPHAELIDPGVVKFNLMRIVNNRFDVSDAHGIKMTQWHVASGYPYMYTDRNNTDMGTWVYVGNTGNCPLMTPGVMDNGSNWIDTYTNPNGPAVYRKSAETHYLFQPYVYDDSLAGSAPSQMLDPADPSHQVQAFIEKDNWGMDWTFPRFWYGNGLGSQTQREDEDYNNRFVGYVYLTRAPYSTSTPDYNDSGSFTVFIRQGRFA